MCPKRCSNDEARKRRDRRMPLKAATVLSLAALASAHGHVATIIAGGVEYPGAVPGNLEPNGFSSADILCHNVTLVWNTWPESHRGPVIDYLASCGGGDCSSVDKGFLSFAKIAEAGLVSGSNSGTWASDELMANGNAWTVTIPSSVAPGYYVLRHEIIALHGAG
ncbi:hypothetical protein jhhlp_000854 [Lomentospora prolificans]|uniref:lytic cellulose monooxygenase (C4-dehydrogenating) n=1 Tax=Lomentospora prolificans TaxID=41688 RepID=A0A2N3NJM3_9PEZI|nr:hypothetical protein jhhlp_000854 [Lomentospora prolificans]